MNSPPALQLTPPSPARPLPACCPQHEWVFKQGEAGDSFYIITTGEAEVIRHPEEGDGHHKTHKLADLGQWSCFGERSLVGLAPAIEPTRECLKKGTNGWLADSDLPPAATSLLMLLCCCYCADAAAL